MPEILAISPSNKTPANVDPQGPGGKPISMFESGANLLSLAVRTGRLQPAVAHGRYTIFEWLMFQMGGVGPMLGPRRPIDDDKARQTLFGSQQYWRR